jgi:hypothetical protein
VTLHDLKQPLSNNGNDHVVPYLPTCRPRARVNPEVLCTRCGAECSRVDTGLRGADWIERASGIAGVIWSRSPPALLFIYFVVWMVGSLVPLNMSTSSSPADSP